MNIARCTPTNSPAAALLDVKAVAALLDCSPRHVCRLADAGKMPPPLRIGALARWPRRTIEDWIEAGCPAMSTQRRAAK